MGLLTIFPECWFLLFRIVYSLTWNCPESQEVVIHRGVDFVLRGPDFLGTEKPKLALDSDRGALACAHEACPRLRSGSGYLCLTSPKMNYNSSYFIKAHSPFD